MKVIYNGVDIYPEVSINHCMHNMYAGGRSDELKIRFNDLQGEWDGWSPQPGDTITVKDGTATTGQLYIHKVKPKGGSLLLRAFSMPPTAMNSTGKSWETVKFHQLCEEVAARHGLQIELHGIQNQTYAYVTQADAPDFRFLHQRCLLEGAAFLVFDGCMIVYDERAMEAMTPEILVHVAPESKYEYDDGGLTYGSAIVTNGLFSGQFIASASNPREFKRKMRIRLSGPEEASRFAMNILRYQNKNQTTAAVWNDNLVREYAPGSMIQLEIEGGASKNGPMFVAAVRNNYMEKSSTSIFRRPLEGY